MRVIAHRGCTDIIRESALEVNWGRKKKKTLLRWGLEPASVLHLAFQSHAQRTELFHPWLSLHGHRCTVARPVLPLTKSIPKFHGSCYYQVEKLVSHCKN